MLFSLSQLKKTYGDKVLFQDLNFGMLPGEKVALVGTNGSGKSTFLRVFLGLEESDAGQIVKKNGLKISFYEQNPSFSPEDSIASHIFQGNNPILKLIREYEECCARLETGGAKEEERFQILSQAMDEKNAWEYESKIKSILGELHVHSLDTPMKLLSGGMLRKVELAKALVADYELLILDEPTNHLDVETILWLENYLVERKEALLLITHDRYFLDRVVDKILEIADGKTYLYDGNYSEYLELKWQREETIATQENKARLFLKKEMQWLKRQPKARTTKQKARKDRVESLKAQTVSERKQELELVFTGKRQGKTILEIEALHKSYGNRKILNHFSYAFKAKERIGIVGPNGVGKSTLLDLFCEKLTPDSGTIKPGVNTVFGYFDQIHRELPLEKKVLEYIKDKAGEMISLDSGEKVSASKLLERFLFDGKLQHTPIQKLSGGERRRLYLVQILMTGPNFLLLDEPTNDLDIQTLSILESFLEEFPGTVVTVSHDRYFMDRVAESLFVFQEGGNLEHYIGNYSSYLADSEKEKKPAEKEKDLSETKSLTIEERNVEKTKLPRGKKPNPKKMEILEKEIADLEKKISEAESDLALYATDPEKVRSLLQVLDSQKPLLEVKLEEWMAWQED